MDQVTIPIFGKSLACISPNADLSMLRNMVGPATQLTQFWVPNITETEERLMKVVQGALRFITAGMAAEVAAIRRELWVRSD